jgi:glucokinase
MLRAVTSAPDLLIGVDVGASTISAGLVRSNGVVLATVQAATHGAGSVTDTIMASIDRIRAQAAERGLPVSGIGVGLPGIVEVEKGYMRPMPATFLSELGDVPLASLIHERTGLAVFVDNDVNALTLGEWMFGHGRGVTSLVTVAIGTGVGGGLIVDGTLVRGRLNTAGEIGHLAVGLTGPTCPCAGIGCLATYVGGGLMPDRARERLGRYPGSAVLARAGGDPARIDAAGLFQAAAAGDPLARSVVDEACEALAIGIGTLVNLLNPEVIVVTGGVAASLEPLRDDILRRARRRALPEVLDATAVWVAPADKRSTVRGGAALVRYELGRRGQVA